MPSGQLGGSPRLHEGVTTGGTNDPKARVKHNTDGRLRGAPSQQHDTRCCLVPRTSRRRASCVCRCNDASSQAANVKRQPWPVHRDAKPQRGRRRGRLWATGWAGSQDMARRWASLPCGLLVPVWVLVLGARCWPDQRGRGVVVTRQLVPG